MPIAPQQLAHGLAAPDLGQRGVVGRRLAGVAGAGVNRLRHIRFPAGSSCVSLRAVLVAAALQLRMSLNLTKSTRAAWNALRHIGPTCMAKPAARRRANSERAKERQVASAT